MTEGMKDEVINGQYRGWADRVADGLAKDNPEFTYMNLAVRGKLLKQVAEDQVPKRWHILKENKHWSHFMLVPMMCSAQTTSRKFLCLNMKKR